MAQLIAVVGPSGKGKSTAILPFPELNIKGLDPKETILINVAGKPMPTKGWKSAFTTNKLITEGGNYASTKDSKTIKQILEYVDKNRPDINNIIIDDAQYIGAFAYMSKAHMKG